ncbi:MAG: mechanosensitive ion channel family protein [Candidatus Omnitrophica bacterium]|nr:mechanosensitive ion channel family protein [Candidatus Omnitrophota bacterium]
MIPKSMYAVYFGNSLLDYCVTGLIFVALCVVLRMLKQVGLRRLKAWAATTTTTIDDFAIHILQQNVMPLLYFGALYFSLQNLTLPAGLQQTIGTAWTVVATIITIRFLVSLINFVLVSVWVKKTKDETRQDSLRGIMTVIKILIWGLGIIVLLDNLGYKVSTVIAGLGIGGVAVALAAQTILGDLFSHFSILFDRPFELGDFIIVGDFMGTVEHIGIKTTRIRSLSGEQLVFSNTDLTNSRVRNYKRMDKRRVLFKLGVVYGTSHARLQEIPGIIKKIVAGINDTAFDRAHFSAFGDFNLEIEVVYFVLSPDYNKYMDIQQAINLAIKQEFEKRDIEFAFPTQTVYVNPPETKRTAA